MYRQVIIPEGTSLILQIPSYFIGKKVEVIAFTLEETKEETVIVSQKRKPSEFAGCISVETAKVILNNQARCRF